MTNRLQHAKHNEDACNYLHQNGEFRDWVITTAFYSALHYILYEVLPLKVNGKTYKTFSKYYKEIVEVNNAELQIQISKHDAQLDLVKERIPDAYESYRWLYESCMNSRYNDYKVSKRKADETIKHLTMIKSHLTKLKK